MPLRTRLIAAAAILAVGASTSAVFAQPEPYGAPSQDRLAESTPAGRDGDRAFGSRHHRHGGGECYAQVRFGPQYAAPPTGPEYVWTQAPGPPGSPGPIWCLTVRSLPRQPVLITPERYGWVRVLCDTDATPGRIADVQRRLQDRGLYRGDIDGRYDDRTVLAVRAFQSERQIEDRGYLSYQTLTALQVAPPPPPRPIYYRQPTTFDTGVLDWPGKSRF